MCFTTIKPRSSAIFVCRRILMVGRHPDRRRRAGRIGQSKYKVEGQTHYSVDLIADSFAILAKAKVKTVEDDMQD